MLRHDTRYIGYTYIVIYIQGTSASQVTCMAGIQWSNGNMSKSELIRVKREIGQLRYLT